MSEPQNEDELFLLRADAHIHLANEQLKDTSRDKVCASIMFAAARFDAWTNACKLANRWQATAKKPLTILSDNTD
jgi:hypothetical protein